MATYIAWTPSYSAPTVSGVTNGTMLVPTVKPSDWALLTNVKGDASYVCTAENSANNVVSNVELKCSTISNPYAWDKQNSVPISSQIPGLTSRKVYAKYTAMGTVSDTLGSNTYIAPVKVSFAIELPSGCCPTVGEIQNQVRLLMGFVSPAITAGTVVPLGKIPAMSNGALLL